MTLIPGISNADYHGDRTSLSCSGAKLLLKSPAKFKHQQQHPVFKDVFDFGTVAHTLVLGDGDDIAVIDAADWRTKAAKEERDQARAEGRTPILAGDYAQCEQMAAAINEHDTARQLLAEGIAEQSGYWQDEPTDVRLRFRPDWMTELDGRALCVDYKTCASADTDEFMRAAAKFGYDIQFAWYVTGLLALGIKSPGLLFVAQEKEAPYLVNVIELPVEAFTAGASKMRRAVDLYAHCTETDTWPGYGHGINTGTWPAWANDHQPTINDLLETAV